MEHHKAPNIDREAYPDALDKFDAAICEAIAVSQASSGRQPAPNVGFASYVFTRMCGAGISLIRAAPFSRWVRADFQDWQLGALAGHARSLMDGYLLFHYLIETPKNEAELKARINVMHLNDCTRRIELFRDLGFAKDLDAFEKQREELRERLATNDHFKSLSDVVQKNCLNGRFLMIDSRDEMLGKVGFKKGEFDALYDFWSQQVHILPLSFYRLEANGRGTGVENDTDRGYMAEALEIGAAILVGATDKMVEQFPDTEGARQGTRSKFSPGPAANLPFDLDAVEHAIQSRSANAPFAASLFTAAIKEGFGG